MKLEFQNDTKKAGFILHTLIKHADDNFKVTVNGDLRNPIVTVVSDNSDSTSREKALLAFSVITVEEQPILLCEDNPYTVAEVEAGIKDIMAAKEIAKLEVFIHNLLRG